MNLTIPEKIDLEVLIVNNNCTDNTDEVINEFSGQLPVRLIHEDTPGLANARNKAIEEANGEYIIWTDDDVLIDKYWLSAYVDAFNQYPDAAVFGGPIEPWFEGSPPEWLQKCWVSIADAYAVRELGREQMPLRVEGNILPYGANYAIRMSEQIRYLYDPKFGLNQKKIILGDETLVIRSILAENFSGRWVPDARIKHWIPKPRQTLDYLKKYYIGRGHTLKQMDTDEASSVKIMGYPRWLLRQTIEAHILYYLTKTFLPPKIWIKYFIKAYINRGQLFSD